MVKEGHNDTISALPLATPIAISCAHTEKERQIDFVGTEEDQHCGQETLLMYPKNKVRAQEQLGHKEGQNAWGRMS